MTQMAFGQRLRTLRKEAKLTQQMVADQLNIHRTTYNKYEAGTVAPDQQGLLVLAEMFSVTVDYMLGRTTDPVCTVEENAGGSTALTDREQALVQIFRQLTAEEQDVLVQQARAAFQSRQA